MIRHRYKKGFLRRPLPRHGSVQLGFRNCHFYAADIVSAIACALVQVFLVCCFTWQLPSVVPAQNNLVPPLIAGTIMVPATVWTTRFCSNQKVRPNSAILPPSREFRANTSTSPSPDAL